MAEPAGTSDGGRGWLLGIDTSSETVSLALMPVVAGVDAGGAELAWQAGRNQTATLLAQIERLCELCEIESDAFAAVVVATGPGGFNALRVGMSVAKGFAFALAIPIFGAGTLDIAAEAVARWGLPVRAFVPAGRGRCVFADYRPAGGRLVRQDEMMHRRTLDLAADLLAPTVLAGDLSVEDEAVLRAAPHVVLPGAGAARRRAAVMIDLVLPRWRTGEPDDLMTLEPLYLHQGTEDARPRAERAQAAGSEARA